MELASLKIFLPEYRKILIPGIAVCFLVSACARYQYEESVIDLEDIKYEYFNRSLNAPELKDYLQKYDIDTGSWPLEAWDISALTAAAWYFNPELKVAQKEYEVRVVESENSARRLNPEINIPLEHHSDTSGNRSPWLIGLLFDLVLERKAKREARMEQAEALAVAAAINIMQKAWSIYSKVRNYLVDYYRANRVSLHLEQQRIATEDILDILEKRKELGEAGEFEVSAVRLELQKIRLQQAEQLVEVNRSLNKLAEAIRIPVSELRNTEIVFDDLESYVNADEIMNFEIQSVALRNRPDIQAALQQYMAHEAGIKYEIEKQYPDIRLSPGFIFDQEDKIWALGAAWILPAFYPVNEAEIKKALAERKVLQAEFIAMQTQILGEINSGRENYLSHHQALIAADNLLVDIETRQAQIKRQFELGYADNLELSRTVLETLLAKQSREKILLALIQAGSQLEDTMQYPLVNINTVEYKTTNDN